MLLGSEEQAPKNRQIDNENIVIFGMEKVSFLVTGLDGICHVF
jgi:hypothetical protein